MSVYLDHNASTAIEDEVLEVMSEVLREVGNASSSHSFGRYKRGLIERSRIQILDFLGADDGWDIIFCPSGTVANNLAVRSFERVFVSSGEHASVGVIPGTCRIALDCSGMVTRENLLLAIDGVDVPFIVSVQGANSETGIIQDVEGLGLLVRERGGFMHSDMVQCVGKLPLSLSGSNLSALSISGHKFGASVGIGALIYRKDFPLRSLVYGGGQERGLLSGSEDVASIVGLERAFSLLGSRLSKISVIESLRDDMESRLRDSFSDLEVVGSGVFRLGNTSCLLMRGVDSGSLVIGMDLAGYAVSSGSACSYGRLVRESSLLGMGYSESDSGCALRVSLGIDTRAVDLDGFIIEYSNFVRKSLGMLS